ncbi:MAG: hypothetical protein ACRDXX_12360 [Stackebrandtia sp.]
MDNRYHHYLPSLEKPHRPLVVFAAVMAVTAVVAAIGLIVDDRVITGASVWAKPLKFSLSFIFYGATLAFLIPLLRKRKRLGWWMGTVIVAASTIEMAVIVGQVVRGRASHFNTSTPLDTALWALMGQTIVVLWLATLTVAVLLWRQNIGDRALTWSIRLGMLVGLVGLALGFLMTMPQDGQAPGAAGGHGVGVPEDGAGLPLLGWSTVGGDLRIPHFVGMHALQVLPLIALVLVWAARRRVRLADEATRVRLVWVAAAGYLGLVGLVTWQALRGESIVHPGGATVAAAVALVIAVAAATAWALRATPPPRREEPASPRPVGASQVDA